MSRAFEELDYQETPMGALSLRRRRLASLPDQEVFEVKLGEEYLMSSLFHAAEVALAELGLAAQTGPLDVVVGGLGLGYTAAAALDNAQVRSLLVVDALRPVITWHEAGLVPLGARLTGDPRCRFVHGDFFALAKDPARGFDPEQAARRFHAVLLDIDHSPRKLLNARHAAFYSPPALQALSNQLHPGGVFAMWSEDAPDDDFVQAMSVAFDQCDAHVITFPNPLTGGRSDSTVYVAQLDP